MRRVGRGAGHASRRCPCNTPWLSPGMLACGVLMGCSRYYDLLNFNLNMCALFVRFVNGIGDIAKDQLGIMGSLITCVDKVCHQQVGYAGMQKGQKVKRLKVHPRPWSLRHVHAYSTCAVWHTILDCHITSLRHTRESPPSGCPQCRGGVLSELAA